MPSGCDSIRKTSAPISASIMVAKGPGTKVVKSRIFKFCKARIMVSYDCIVMFKRDKLYIVRLIGDIQNPSNSLLYGRLGATGIRI